MKKLIKKWWVWVIVFFVLGIIGTQIQKNDDTPTTTSPEKVEATTEQQKVLDVLNDFPRFVEAYNQLEDKTPTWDNFLYGKTVTWMGYVVRIGTSQIFVYGKDDYNGEDWNTLGDSNKLFYAFTAEFKNKEDFKELKTGDKVTLKGSLESRGDLNLNYNWKLYDVELVK
jgi:hypothetical protein